MESAGSDRTVEVDIEIGLSDSLELWPLRSAGGMKANVLGVRVGVRVEVDRRKSGRDQ